jgi:hypothetical protein
MLEIDASDIKYIYGRAGHAPLQGRAVPYHDVQSLSRTLPDMQFLRVSM